MEPGRLGTIGPTRRRASGPTGGEHPAVRRGGPVLGPGAERSAGSGCIDMDTTRRTRRDGPPEDRARSHLFEPHPVPLRVVLSHTLL
jgi:hypothetical protein